MKPIVIFVALLLLAGTLFGQSPAPQSFSVERIYQEIVSPLQSELWTMKLSVLALRDELAKRDQRIQFLEEENKKLKALMDKPHD